jgi:hypothetical protein
MQLSLRKLAHTLRFLLILVASKEYFSHGPREFRPSTLGQLHGPDRYSVAIRKHGAAFGATEKNSGA